MANADFTSKSTRIGLKWQPEHDRFKPGHESA